MARSINLRQVEIFKAFIELGTVSRAAEALGISQPAASKLLVHLESDSDLRLFDRYKGRLSPTPVGLRLYEEVSRIFTGVRQVESAISFIRREDQARLTIGVIPAFAGVLIQRATMAFLEGNPNVHLTFQSKSSQWIIELILARKLDLGMVSAQIDNPYVVAESLLEHPLVCILPVGHPLADKDVITPSDLNGTPFITFSEVSYTGQQIASIFEKHNVDANVVLVADVSPTVCQFVASGLGVSLVHPLFLAGMGERIVARPFEPATPIGFLLCYARDARNADLISEFVTATSATATRLIEEVKRSWS